MAGGGPAQLAAAAHQGWSANIFTTASDMFPADMVGTVVSFGQVAGALGGAIFQPLLDISCSSRTVIVPLFLYSAFAYLLALLILRTLAPGLKRANWRAEMGMKDINRKALLGMLRLLVMLALALFPACLDARLLAGLDLRSAFFVPPSPSHEPDEDNPIC